MTTKFNFQICIQQSLTVYKLVAFFIIALSLVGCTQSEIAPDIATVQYNADTLFEGKSAPKVWAHRVNDIQTAETKSELFNGLEVDLFYSDFQDELLVAHDLEDTINQLTFKEWLSAIEHTDRLHYWIDMKNLNPDNASIIALKLNKLAEQFQFEGHFIVESSYSEALKILSDLNVATLLWVPDISYWEVKDTLAWMQHIQNKIDFCEPNGISGFSYTLYPLLSDSFPNENVYYWNTPFIDFEENSSTTIEACQVENVKAVLVDYDEPVAY